MRILLALTLLLCGCASTVPKGDMSAIAAAAPDRATIYVFHASAAIVSENLPLYVGGEKIGVLPLRGYTWFQCPPGTYEVAIGDAMISHRMLAATKLAAAAGEAVYLKYVLKPRSNELALVSGHLGDLVTGKQVSRPEPLMRVRPDEAEKMLKSYELVGNTFDQKRPNKAPEPTPAHL